MKITTSTAYDLNEKLKNTLFFLEKERFSSGLILKRRFMYIFDFPVGYLENDKFVLDGSGCCNLKYKFKEFGKFIVDYYHGCESEVGQIEEATGREVIIRKHI